MSHHQCPENQGDNFEFYLVKQDIEGQGESNNENHHESDSWKRCQQDLAEHGQVELVVGQLRVFGEQEGRLEPG